MESMVKVQMLIKQTEKSINHMLFNYISTQHVFLFFQDMITFMDKMVSRSSLHSMPVHKVSVGRFFSVSSPVHTSGHPGGS